MYWRKLATAIVAVLLIANPTQAQTEATRAQAISHALGLENFGAYPPPRIFDTLDGYRYDISSYALPLLEGKGKRPEIVDWLQRIYGTGSQMQFTVRSYIPADGSGFPAVVRDDIAAFSSSDVVISEWSRFDRMREGSVTLYLGTEEDFAKKPVQADVARSCTMRACILLGLDRNDENGIKQAIDWVQRIAAHFATVQEERLTGINIMPDGTIWAPGSHPHGNLKPIEFARDLMRSEGATVVGKNCGVVLETANNGGPISASYICRLSVDNLG